MDTAPHYREQVDRALNWLDRHHAEPIDFDQAADEGGFSRFHFQRVFKAVCGETPGDYLRRIRLEGAMRQVVENPSMSLTEIAIAHGFSSQSLFSRLFHAHFGKNPRWFRQNSRFSLAEGMGHRPLTGGNTPALSPELRFSPAATVAYVRTNGYSIMIGLAYRRLFEAARKSGLLAEAAVGGSARQVLGIPLDNPEITKPGACRFLAALTVPPGTAVKPPLERLTIPETWLAVIPYRGPYAGIRDAHAALYCDWLIGSDYQPLDFPSYQIIKRNPWRDGGTDFDMEICLPVKKQWR